MKSKNNAIYSALHVIHGEPNAIRSVCVSALPTVPVSTRGGSLPPPAHLLAERIMNY